MSRAVESAPPLSAWLAGRIGHDAYLGLAERLAWEVSEPGGRCPTLLVCELEPAITVGRLGSRRDIQIGDDELRARGLAVRYTGRGGGAVLHGPGQIFAALFARLEDLGLPRHGVGLYLDRLEEGVVETLRLLGCAGRRVAGSHGVFGRSGLLAAIAVSVRRGVASHGVFLNIHHPADPCRRVRALGGGCGRAVPGTMGSVEAEVRRRVRFAAARSALVRCLGDAVGCPRVNLHAGFPLRLEAPRRGAAEELSRVG